MPKDLKDKAIDIKGKKYVLVSDRIIYFNDTYPDGYINTELISEPESDIVLLKATVWPDHKNAQRRFTGYSQAIKGDGFINKTAALENAETSAVGRALAMMGIGVIDSVASIDEINKAQGSEGKRQMKFATPKQIEWIRSEARGVSGFEQNDDVDEWVEKVLTVKPQHVPLHKVKDAVDKIKESKDKDEVVDVPEGEINLDEIPY